MRADSPVGDETNDPGRGVEIVTFHFLLRSDSALVT